MTFDDERKRKVGWCGGEGPFWSACYWFAWRENCQTWWDKSQLFLDGMKSRIARFLQCFFSCVAFFDRNLNSKKSAPILWSWDFSHFFPDIWVCQMVSQTSPKPCDTCFCTKNCCFMGWEKQQKPLFWNCKAPREKPIVSHLPINTRKASLLCKIFFVCFGLLDQKSPEFGRYPSRFFFSFRCMCVACT